MNHLGRALTDETMGIHALFVWNGNPVVSVPNAGQTRRGLEREDLFTVVSEQFITDTALYADVVFPAATEIEQLDMIPVLGSSLPGVERGRDRSSSASRFPTPSCGGDWPGPWGSMTPSSIWTTRP